MRHKLAALLFIVPLALFATSMRIEGRQVDDSKPHGAVPSAYGSAQGAKKPEKKAPAPPAPPPPKKPAWKEFKLNPKTTMFLDFTDANPDMIISIFSRTSGITILKDPNFKVTLTVTSATKVSLDKAFEIFNTVLGFNGYELQKKGDLMVVGRMGPPPPTGPPPPPPPPQAPTIKTYKLEHAGAAQVAKVINDLYTQTPTPGAPPGTPGAAPAPGGPPRNPVKATSEEYSNSVVVSAFPQDLQAVEQLIKDLDKSSQLPLSSRVFHLKHVSADAVVGAIRDVLSADTPNGKGAKSGQGQSQGYFGYYGFGGGQNEAGAQSATAIKETNSVLVNATPENMETISKLIDGMDEATSYIGNTFVIHLENAKAADVATLLNQVFTEKTSGNENPFYLYFGGGAQKNEGVGTDIDENGNVVNVRDLTGKVNVNADPNTNDLVIATTPSNMPLIEKVVKELDRVSDQVMIEAIIVEANLDRSTQLGVEFNFLKGTSSGQQNFGLQSGQTTNGTLQGFQYTLNAANYSVFLNALQTDTRFTVLDTPRIFTSNNVKAEINVSQKLPYATSSQTGIVGGIVSTYDFLNVGVNLKVTPRITSAGQVTMDVDQSADTLQNYTSFNAPIVNHREATTTVTVSDGQTIILGGIISKSLSVTQNKVPLLGDIPIIGYLFRSTSHDAAQTELMVLLTPHIVRHPEDARQLRDREMKEMSRPSQNEVKKATPSTNVP